MIRCKISDISRENIAFLISLSQGRGLVISTISEQRVIELCQSGYNVITGFCIWEGSVFTAWTSNSDAALLEEMSLTAITKHILDLKKL